MVRHPGVDAAGLDHDTRLPAHASEAAEAPDSSHFAQATGHRRGLAVTFGLIWVTGWLHRLFFGRIIDATVTAIAAGGTVALSWTCLALAGGGRPNRAGWTGWGRLLGVMAIAVGMIAFLLYGI